MFLKRIEVVGFKSFATHLATDLPPGIVVIVGPNGSGKSNVADAVRWVLGEQSARAVRARKPEEVIFAGSASRQPMGMAEVSLVLDNADRTIPLDFNEVRVSRRLYRNGDSEYLLNDARVRLRDITSHLLHARLGSDSYCVIGQGSVDELILQRPEERRIVFENAADVRRHQLKLNETRNKLTATEGNLTRVQDVIAELAPHVRRLKGQAERASRADVIKAELDDLSGLYYRYRLWQSHAELRLAETALDEANAVVAAAEARSTEAQTLWAQGESALSQLDERLAEVRPKAQELRERLRAAERGVAVVRERTTALAEQRASIGGEIESLTTRQQLLAGEADSQTSVLGEVDSRRPVDDALPKLREQLAQVRAQANEAEREVISARRERDVAEGRILEAERTLAQSEARRREAETRGGADAARRAERQARAAQLEESLTQVGTELAEARARLEEARQARQQAEDLRRAAADRVNRSREAVRVAAQTEDRLHGALQALGVGASVDPAKLDPAWRDALEGLPIVGFASEATARIRPLDRLIRGYLSRVAVVQTEAEALAVQERLASAFGEGAPAWGVVSLDGAWFGPSGRRSLTASEDEGSALADWRARVQEAEAQVERARAATGKAETDLNDAVEQLRVAEDAAAAARAVASELDGLVQQVRRSEQSGRSELDVVTTDLKRMAEADRRDAENRQATEQAVVRATGDLAEARAAREKAAERLATVEERLRNTLVQVTEANTALSEAQAGFTLWQSERSAVDGILSRIRADIDSVAAGLTRARERLERLEGATEEAAAQASRHAAEAQGLAAELIPVEQSIAELEQARADLATSRRSDEARLSDLRATERNAHEQRERALVHAERKRDELNRLNQEVADSADVDGSEEGADWARQLRLSDDVAWQAIEEPKLADPDATRKRIASLQRDLRAMGGVSSDVLAEYTEMSDRHDFLVQQSADLRDALGDLREAEGELEEHMRGRFGEVFEAVNTAFQECFRTLFGGGEAQLVLTQPDNLLASGVDIMARPPGKKLQSLLTLSGGERALTVVALLFGLLKVNPTPFCVLDEVDAALDEANVQRFANLLAEFSREIQFVVVTHNRATMEMADAMFGVTMDDAGVSHVFSVEPRSVASKSQIGRPTLQSAEPTPTRP